MRSMTRSSTSRSARSCSVQTVCPAGGLLQASAMSRASPVASSLGVPPGRGRSYSARWSRSPGGSTGAAAKRRRTRWTVAVLVCSATATSASNRSSAAASRMCARRMVRAGAVPRLIRSTSSARSASLNSTRYCLVRMRPPDSSEPKGRILRTTPVALH